MKKSDKYLLLFRTIKFLKPKQVYYRLYYLMLSKCSKNTIQIKSSTVQALLFQDSLYAIPSYLGDNEFKFLNISKKFETIDWNYSQNGKLWTYNLSYFDFLSQKKSKDFRYLIDDFIDNFELIKDGLEPFPISLRGINWIKYLRYHKIESPKINDNLYAQYQLLLQRVEYHLLGNHLLENGFSLFFAAYYFGDEQFYKQSKKILLNELNEQILNDGAHFELSPMYHQLMLYRLLDCINLAQNNTWKNLDFLDFLRNKAALMLGWLENMTYKDGTIPLLNDSAKGIAPTSEELFNYAKRLNLEIKNLKLDESGYRKVIKNDYEIVIDVGQIGPDYIPGHAHSDTFNFELKIKDQPCIVDTGLSTYETNERRAYERSTSAHNTVEVNGKNQSEVWGAFRVANRAYVTELNEEDDFIEATHDGYKNEGIFHTRKWTFLKNKILIEERVNKSVEAMSRLHFHPSITKEKIVRMVKCDSQNFVINKYKYASGFNLLIDAYVMEILFTKELKIDILV